MRKLLYHYQNVSHFLWFLISFFFQMFFEDNIDDDKYCGHLFGLGASYSNGSSAVAFKIGQGLEGTS